MEKFFNPKTGSKIRILPSNLHVHSFIYWYPVNKRKEKIKKIILMLKVRKYESIVSKQW